MNELEQRFHKSARSTFLAFCIYFTLCIMELFFMPIQVMRGIAIVGGIYIIVHAVFIKYQKEWLFMNGLLSAFAILQAGILLGNAIDFTGVMAIGIAISLVDVLSFTKAGKRTINAKAMSDVHFMSKLIVYGRGKDGKLLPTCGIGDYFYYAVWITGIHTVCNHFLAYVAAGILILIGTCINSWIISGIYQKESYKGIPATIVPFFCVSTEYVTLFIINTLFGNILLKM